MAKGLKTLNPADKARKEARKKELKKNKKQRQQVRSAVIERKDPELIMADLEKLDQSEFNPDNTTVINEGFYKDKRKRLKETWAKVLEYYQKEDPEKHAKLKKLEADYESRHRKLVKEFEAVKAAKEVNIEDVFLPPDLNSAMNEIADDDPLMANTIYIIPSDDAPKPPGCPPGLPPNLKILAESLSTSVVMPIQHIHPNMMEANQYNQWNVAKRGDANRSYHGKNKDKYHKNNLPRANIQAFKGSALKDQDQQKPEFNKKQPQSTSNTAAKPAVIESKPVIFMHKTTKFVPSSVRSKLNQGTYNKP